MLSVETEAFPPVLCCVLSNMLILCKTDQLRIDTVVKYTTDSATFVTDPLFNKVAFVHDTHTRTHARTHKRTHKRTNAHTHTY